MRHLALVIASLLFSKPFAQTHFTIPQNVWRITYNQGYTSGNWKAKSLSNGIQHSYKIDTTNYLINQFFERTINQARINIEYGFTDRATFVLNVPYIQKINEKHDWNSDSSSAQLDDLINYYANHFIL